MFRHIKFTPLPVTDQDRAVKFYRDTMGLTVATDDPFQGERRWIEIAIEGGQTRILFVPRADEAPGKEPSLNLIVDNLKETAAFLRQRGVSFVEEPREAPWWPGEWYATFRDSENNLILIGTGVSETP